MNFDFTDEQRGLQDTLARFIERQYGFEQRRVIAASARGSSDANWRQLADLGVLALPFAAEDGGIGGSAADAMIVMEAFGRALMLEPYLPCVLLAGSVLAASGNAAQKNAGLAPMIAGERYIALAHAEARARFALARVESTARRTETGYVLNGHKCLVLGGPLAQTLIVSARIGGAVDDPEGIALYLVDATAPGVHRRDYRLHDGGAAADVRLDSVMVGDDARLDATPDSHAVLEAAYDRAGAALVAEAVGIMQALCDTTLDYLKTRRQFGVPIGKFQALQHRMVEMLMATEQARSMAILAAMHADGSDASTRGRAIAGARAYVADAARLVGQEAVQLHGGMGMVDEHIVSHWFKRLTMIGQTFGDGDHHLARFSDGLRAA
jgi:alkylation response protein AidB-like acyl-CoA dehydrogenase